MINKKDIDESLDEASMLSKDRSEDIPEAPAVANIKCWIRGYGVMLTVRGEKMMDIVRKTETLIDYAESHGWKNTWNTTETTPQATTSQPTVPQTICGIHGTAMKWLTGTSKKTGKPYAFWSCSSKNADGSYCSFKPENKHVLENYDSTIKDDWGNK